MDQPLLLKSDKLSSHMLLHMLKDVLEAHPGLFEWTPTDRGDASHITHASFDFRERTEDTPPFRLHVERVDGEYVGLTLIDDVAEDAAECRQFVERSFYRLYEATLKTKKDEVGVLSYYDREVA